MPRSPKEFHEYLVPPTTAHVGHDDYVRSPATAFLKYTVEAKSSVDLCIRRFTRKADGAYRKDSLDSIQHLVAGMLPAVMGHFETYERYLFASMFDLSSHLTKFDVDQFLTKLTKEREVSIDLRRLAAYRGVGAQSIGLLLADSLSGWQNPKRVDEIFGAFGLPWQLLSAESCRRLSVLWQLRHSIVHTGGTLTLADSQKVPDLATLGDRKVVFDERFISEVARKLHPLVKSATDGMGAAYVARLEPSTPSGVRSRVDDLFTVRSSVPVWLRP